MRVRPAKNLSAGTVACGEVLRSVEINLDTGPERVFRKRTPLRVDVRETKDHGHENARGS